MIKQEILDSFQNKNCVVTGGTGLIGREVVRILAEAGAKVISVSLDDIKPVDLPNVIYLKWDLRNFSDCKVLMEDIDYVAHVAGVKGSIEVTKSKPASFFVPLLQFNTNVLEAARLANVKGLVYTSSIGAYPPAEVFVEGDDNRYQGTDNNGVTYHADPMDFYAGWAKRVAEMQIEAYKTQYGLKNFAVVRPCNVYGPGDNFDPDNAMVIPSLIWKISETKEGDKIKIWGDGSAIRDFAYARDVAEGTILALYHQPDVPYVNLGSGLEVSIKQLVETLHEVISFDYEFDTTKSSGFPRRVMNIDLARRVIGYNPETTLKQGLKETWEWFLENQTEYTKKQNYFKEV
jgi:GDP-L-fucose synthase